MATLIGNICRAATRTSIDKLNILTFPTHERFEQGLARTGHNFYAWRGEGIKDWKDIYAMRPSNYVLLNKELCNNQIPLELDLDLILCQNKFGQYPIAAKLSRELHLPLICLEHTLPMNDWLNRLEQFKSMRGHINVFISEYSRKSWGWEKSEAIVIHHGVDTTIFAPDDSINREIHVLSVVNDFVNRDWCVGFKLWQEVTQGLPIKLLGDTPGLSKPAASIAELVGAYRKCRVFLNTSLVSPIPTVLLEAMSCGCSIVSTNTCMIPDIIIDGHNGFICKTAKEMRQCIELLLEDKKLAYKLGEAARETINKHFQLERFISDWQKVFKLGSNMVYTEEPHESKFIIG